MKLITFTTLDGTPTDVSPLHLLGAKGSIVTANVGGKERQVMGCMIALPDGARPVLQSPDEVRRLFQEAMEGVAINVIALQPEPPNDALG